MVRFSAFRALGLFNVTTLLLPRFSTIISEAVDKLTLQIIYDFDTLNLRTNRMHESYGNGRNISRTEHLKLTYAKLPCLLHNNAHAIYI